MFFLQLWLVSAKLMYVSLGKNEHMKLRALTSPRYSMMKEFLGILSNVHTPHPLPLTVLKMHKSYWMPLCTTLFLQSTHTGTVSYTHRWAYLAWFSPAGFHYKSLGGLSRSMSFLTKMCPLCWQVRFSSYSQVRSFIRCLALSWMKETAEATSELQSRGILAWSSAKRISCRNCWRSLGHLIFLCGSHVFSDSE